MCCYQINIPMPLLLTWKFLTWCFLSVCNSVSKMSPSRSTLSVFSMTEWNGHSRHFKLTWFKTGVWPFISFVEIRSHPLWTSAFITKTKKNSKNSIFFQRTKLYCQILLFLFGFWRKQVTSLDQVAPGLGLCKIAFLPTPPPPSSSQQTIHAEPQTERLVQQWFLVSKLSVSTYPNINGLLI